MLVADIGGTNCRFELWRVDLKGGHHEQLFSKVRHAAWQVRVKQCQQCSAAQLDS